MTEQTLKGRTALITGGGTGIGRGIALAFARAGANVAITGRRPEPLAQTVAELRQAGATAVGITGDVAAPADCRRMVDACVRQCGALHILVNNAGVGHFAALEDTDDAEIARLITINFTGTVAMTKYAIPELSKHTAANAASVLNISSGAAQSVIKNFAVYSAAKAGVVHFTRCMALELAERRVRVNCICPGVVETPIFSTMMPPAAIRQTLANFATQTPLGRVGQPEDIAQAALYLTQADWVTGAVLTVDGGLGLA